MSDLEPASIRQPRNLAGAILTEWAAPLLKPWARARCGPPTPPVDWRRLVILGSSHIGDVLFRTASLPVLRRALPHCHISYACEPLAAELLATNPNVDATLAVHDARQLEGFDAALCTNHIAYHRDLMMATRAGIANRVAFVHKGLSALATWPVRAEYPRPAPGYTRAMVAAVTGAEPTWPITPQVFLTADDVHEADQALPTLEIDLARPLIACTLTNRQPHTRTWPVADYLRTLELVAHDRGATVVLCGSAEDAPMLHAAAAACHAPCRVLTGLRLRAFAAFLRRCDVLLSTDSGPRHLANAVGTPVVFVRSLNVSRIEIGAYCDNESDACGDEEWLSPAAQDTALARIRPEHVAELLYNDSDMRVGLDVHVLTGPAQGTATVWRAMLRQLPTDATYVLYSFDPTAMAKEFPEPHFVHRRIPVRQPHLRFQLAYPWLARRDRCDVFHTNYYLPLLAGPGSVVTIHDVIYLDFPAFAPPGMRARFGALTGWAARHARAVLAPSAYTKGRLVERFGIPPDRVTVVPNALAPEWHAPDDAAIADAWGRLRARVHLPERFVLGVGRFDPRKNVVASARAARALEREGMTDGLVWVGGDDFGSAAIERSLEAEGLRVIRLERLTTIELQAVYRHAQALVFLSLAEGYGYPPLEAMAMGTPAVVSNRTAMPEVVGTAARLVDPNDGIAVIEALCDVIAHPTAYRAAGLAHAARFKSADMAMRTAAVYRRAAGD